MSDKSIAIRITYDMTFNMALGGLMRSMVGNYDGLPTTRKELMRLVRMGMYMYGGVDCENSRGENFVDADGHTERELALCIQKLLPELDAPDVL